MKLAHRFDTNMANMRTGGYNHMQMMSSAPIYYLDIKMGEVVMLASEMEFWIIELQVQVNCILCHLLQARP